MKIVFLGTASCFPTPSRGVSCTALQHDDGQVWLFDCGEASQVQIQKSCIKPGKITKIFISHLHGDHIFGLPGLLCSMGNGMDPGVAANTIIELYGPHGIRKFVTTSLGLARSPLVFKLSVIELVPRPDQYPSNWADWPVDHEVQDQFKLPTECEYRRVECSKEEKCWNLFSKNGMTVKAAALVHRIPSFGFHIQEADGPGSLDAVKLQAVGIKPGPIYGKLKAGKTVEFEGNTLRPEDFLGPNIPGREIVIHGDTSNSDQMLGLTKCPDVFVHEATMENSLKEKSIEFGHSTPEMAADVALRAGAKKLVIFHLSPRYRPIGEAIKKDDCSASTILEEAKSYVSKQKSSMEVDVAHDFMEVEISKRASVLKKTA